MIDKGISFVGTGNVSWQLSSLFGKTGIKINQVFSRSPQQSDFNGIPLVNLAHYKGDDLLFICVPDDHIPEIKDQLKKAPAAMIHCSGAKQLGILQNDDNIPIGVYYPLQSISKGRMLKATDIPVFIESNDENLRKALFLLADSAGQEARQMSSEKRKYLHLSAVMINNFSNHLWHKAADFASSRQLDSSIFEPLLKETLRKFIEMGGEKAQTGPARRGDRETIKNHREMLGEGEMEVLYKYLSESILKTFNDN